MNGIRAKRHRKKNFKKKEKDRGHNVSHTSKTMQTIVLGQEKTQKDTHKKKEANEEKKKEKKRPSKRKKRLSKKIKKRVRKKRKGKAKDATHSHLTCKLFQENKKNYFSKKKYRINRWQGSEEH